MDQCSFQLSCPSAAWGIKASAFSSTHIMYIVYIVRTHITLSGEGHERSHSLCHELVHTGGAACQEKKYRPHSEWRIGKLSSWARTGGSLRLREHRRVAPGLSWHHRRNPGGAYPRAPQEACVMLPS